MKIHKSVFMIIALIFFASINLYAPPLFAQNFGIKPHPEENMKQLYEDTKQVLTGAITPTPAKVYSTFKYLKLVSEGIVKKDMELTKALAIKGGIKLSAGALYDAAIDVITKHMKEKGAFEPDGVLGKVTLGRYHIIDEYTFPFYLKSVKNAVVGGVVAEGFTALSAISDSWKETSKLIKEWPSDAPMDGQIKFLKTCSNLLDKLAGYTERVLENTIKIPTALAPTTFYGASDSWDDAVTVAQDQTTEGVDNNPTFTSGGNYWGHIALMLTKSGTLEDIYSTLGPTNLASSNISIPSYRSSRDMTMNGTSSPPQITALETSTGAVTVGIPVSIDMYELGNNSYATWGYWLQNNIMQAGGTNYSVDNRGYYLTGDPTTNAQMTNLSAHNNSGTYTGTANGTYWTNTGGTNMSGTFNANVSFASRSLNDINISISGGGHSASISGATATSSGSSSTFIGNSDGQWKIDGATLGSSSSKDLRGVVCGPTGKAVVGGFGMGQTVDTTGVVIGIFQGTR
ncbi:MAG: hypothetical protein Q7J15_06905 [Candidatus Desulfaltia sp.]|nr:hypothetical protein [Candidatus Desulfaltia sp.]